MSFADKAISRIRELIQTGELPPGAKLPPKQRLTAQLGLSRSLMREAVKALVVARVWRGMLSAEQIAASGVPLGLVRLAAGTEDTADLVTDVLKALEALDR
jgi:DNA-binding transcriptional MocR family regulator